MDASTRLYARLAEIPSDPSDPDSLAELLVCAFGAFERYYICWKTHSGTYKQDSYDLPPALQEWLYPSDGTTRDFSTLQVVFGRGEEYFASDKDGKVEFKEPESAPKPAEVEQKADKGEKRRSRTVSFLRPLSEVSTRTEAHVANEVETNRQSASSATSALSRRASRPPSLSWSRTNSASSLWSSLGGHAMPLGTLTSPGEFESPHLVDPDEGASPGTATKMSYEMSAMGGPRKQASSSDLAEFKIPEGYMLVPIESTPRSTGSAGCSCACHEHVHKSEARTTYSDASTQIAAELTPNLPRSNWASEDTLNTPDFEDEDMFEDHVSAENPIFMGRMMTYFSKPGYQLGDSLVSGYVPVHMERYEDEDEYG